jgi:hypothetical protein
MVNLRRKFHRLPCSPCNRRPAACEGVGGILYTHAQPAQRTRQRGKALYLQRNLGNACAGFRVVEDASLIPRYGLRHHQSPQHRANPKVQRHNMPKL